MLELAEKAVFSSKFTISFIYLQVGNDKAELTQLTDTHFIYASASERFARYFTKVATWPCPIKL